VIKKLILPLLLLTGSAFADFNFNLTNSPVSTYPGGIFDTNCFSGGFLKCVFLQGMVTNTDPVNEIDFLSLSVTWDPSSPSTTALTSNDDFFFNSWGGSGGTVGFPAFLGGGESFTGILFEIDVPPLFDGDTPAPLGQYFGTVTVNAVDINNNPFVQQQTFEVDVVPEPATWLLMLIGLGAFSAVARKRWRTAIRG
jgi:PEP-CTERM motif